MVRNALPLSLEVRVLCLSGVNEQPEEEERVRRRSGMRRSQGRDGRERVVARRLTLRPGCAVPVPQVDPREYVWVAARVLCNKASAPWAVAKLNARSWRRRATSKYAIICDSRWFFLSLVETGIKGFGQ